MNPHVTTVVPLPGYELLLTFDNGEQRIFSVGPYLERGVFVGLKNTSVFMQAKVVAGSIEWPGEIDLSYDTLYLGSHAREHSRAA